MGSVRRQSQQQQQVGTGSQSEMKWNLCLILYESHNLPRRREAQGTQKADGRDGGSAIPAKTTWKTPVPGARQDCTSTNHLQLGPGGVQGMSGGFVLCLPQVHRAPEGSEEKLLQPSTPHCSKQSETGADSAAAFVWARDRGQRETRPLQRLSTGGCLLMKA